MFVISWIHFLKVILVTVLKFRIFLSEDPPSTGSDVEKQLLEAARSGDMEVVKVNGNIFVNYQVLGYVNFKTITDERNMCIDLHIVMSHLEMNQHLDDLCLFCRNCARHRQ